MPNRLNELLLLQLKQEFEPIGHGIFFDYTGLTVFESDELRGKLIKEALKIQVIRNRIAKLALMESAGADLSGVLKGPIAVVYGNDDPVEAAKAVLDCAKANTKIQIRGGFLEGAALDPTQVESLSKMPSKNELLGQILTAINSPAQTFVSGINEILRNLDMNGVANELSGLLTAYHQKLQEEAG